MLFERHIEPRHVKQECERRIVARYPLGKQSTILMRGDAEAAEMRSYVERMIAASHRLEAMTPIPHDFTDEIHWSDPNE